MAAKGVNDLAAAKAAKQKKIAIVGSVLLVALLAFQVPRTMKMLKGSSAPPPRHATTETTPATPTTPAATSTPAAVSSATPTSSSAQLGGDALVVTADLSPVPLDGQLVDLTAFTTKDPFVQKKVDVDKGGGTAAGSTAGGKGSGSSKGDGGSFTTPGKGSGSGSGSSDKGSGSGAKPAVPAPTVAQISVNGTEETVAKDADFPAASPLFHLVSLTATTAKISIAGGSLASGNPTVTLKLGKPLTLMNTADGSRYVIVLISTSAASATTPAAPTTTTTTPTTTTPTGG